MLKFPGLACCLATSGILALTGCKKSAAPAQTGNRNQTFIVEVLTIAPQPFRETLFATGTLLANESVTLQAERAGVVKEIRFEEGKPVKAGEVLVVIDDADLQAQLAKAKAQLELATASERRQRDLLRSKGISEVEYDQSEANLHIAQADERLIQAQLAKTRITAPFSGIIGLRQVSLGAYLTPGTTICTLSDIVSLKLDFTLPERYLPYISVGEKVTCRIAGRPETFEATVAAIEPTVDVATRSLQVRTTLNNENLRLLPGSFAEVEVSLDEIEDAILIPPIALVPGLQRQTVFVHRDGQVEERKVQPGIRTADAIQILEGLNPGDELITTGVLQLRAGMRVQVKKAQVTGTQPAATAEAVAVPQPAGGAAR